MRAPEGVERPISALTSANAKPSAANSTSGASSFLPAARRRPAGSDAATAVPKESANKQKPQSPGVQAAFRTPRDPSSLSGGVTGTSQNQAGQISPASLAVQAKGSPQRRRSPLQDEEPPTLPMAAITPPVAWASAGGGSGSPTTSGGPSPTPAVAAAVLSTSPRGEVGSLSSSTKVKELESRLPPNAKVRELESRLSASTKAQVREVEAKAPASNKAPPAHELKARLQTASTGKASPPPVPRGWRGVSAVMYGLDAAELADLRRGPPGLSWPGPPPGLPGIDAAELAELRLAAEVSGETDSFDEDVELLRCQAELVEAAAEIGTTSADDDLLTTDPELEDDEDAFPAPPSKSAQRWQFNPSVVIEEDEEDEDGYEVDGSEMRGRLWAQSLLRLKRSIDEIYSLCEYESDEIMCEEVRGILGAASQDFQSLMKRFETQQEYALLPGEFPLKTGVAWTTRTPKARSPTSGESAVEVLERAQSPGSTSGRTASKDLRRLSLTVDNVKRRSSSRDPQQNRLLDEQAHDLEGATGGTGEAGGAQATGSGGGREGSREDHLQSMVQSALQRIQQRLGRASKLSPEELSKRSEERHRRAQQLRAEQEMQRLSQLRQRGNRVLVAQERRQQKEQQMQGELMEKMTRARRQYQEQLRSICEKARNQNRKTEEVVYVTKEALKTEKEIMRQKQENARLARALLREQLRKKLLQSANRVATVSENKRRQQETWQTKVLQELEEKDRLASQRRKQHIHSIRMKSHDKESHSEKVREKQRENQEEDERLLLQQQQDFVSFRSRKGGRLALNVDGLPDGVREEVCEQLRAAVLQPSTASGSRDRTARSKVAAPGWGCSTPPRRQPAALSESLKSSPKSDVLDLDEDIDEDVEPCASRQATSSKPRGHDRKSRKARAKARPAAKGIASWPADARDVVPLVDDVDGAATANASGSADNYTCGGIEEATCEQAARDREVTPPASSDGSDGEVYSDQEGSDAGDPAHVGDSETPKSNTAIVPVGDSLGVGDAEISSCGLALPTGDSSHSVKSASRPKAKADPKDSRHRRSVSPPDAGAGPADNDPQVAGAMSDSQMYLDVWRKQLFAEALSDDEALKVATQSDGSRAAAVNAAHRARISKLATDLGRVIPLLGNTLGIASSAVAEDSSGQQLGAHSLDLERADAVLSEFCKVLDQSQREADYALVLQLGCVGKVMDICSRIKDSMSTQSGTTERNMPPAMKQLSSVMLSSLKWLNLLSKQKCSRVFLLLTNRVVLLGDVAVTCLSTTPLETQTMPSLFLPQVFHVLSLHVKQTLPDSASAYRQKLISYLLVCGLSEKLSDLFKGAGLRGMRLFDGASPLPLLLLRAMCLLGTLVNAYRLPAEGVTESVAGAASDELSPAPVLQVLRRTDLFGIVSVLGAILFEKGKPPSSQAADRAKLPQTVTSLVVQAVRILNQVARIDLETLQEVLGGCQQEFYHLLVFLLDYCTLHQGPKPSQGQDESELLHESIALLGNYCLSNKEHQALMCYGEGQTLLAKITSLPLHYFMDEKGKLLLFPTILSTCFESEENLELLRNEMNLSLLRNFLAALLTQKDDMRPNEAALNGFGGRFPCALWARALEFFSDEGSAPSS